MSVEGQEGHMGEDANWLNEKETGLEGAVCSMFFKQCNMKA